MAFEVLWYLEPELDVFETREFGSKKEAMKFYEEHKNDADKFGWWVTKRNKDWEVVQDLVS